MVTRRVSDRFCWLPLVALVACTGSDSGCGTQPIELADEMPFRDGWEVAAEVDFVHTDADGSPLITELLIGGTRTNDNFVNRGDVVVLFDGPPDRMKIEMRPFVAASDEDSARVQLDRIELWAYEGSVVAPHRKDAEDSCLDGWRAGCQIRVWEDGATQREVSGADLRITLPPDFRGKIDVQTEDNNAVSDYLNRADVCIEGLPGSASVSLQSGRAWVSLADAISPAPTCPAADVAACEAWTGTDAEGNEVAQPWAPECPCAAGGHAFGGVEVDTRDVDAADVLIDVPPPLWLALSLENRLVDTLDRDCEAGVVLDADGLDADVSDSDAIFRGSYNFPGSPAIEGAGYRISARSGTCGPVAHTDAPEQFVGKGNGDEQPTERRGFLEVCSDCALPCDELVR